MTDTVLQHRPQYLKVHTFNRKDRNWQLGWDELSSFRAGTAACSSGNCKTKPRSFLQRIVDKLQARQRRQVGLQDRRSQGTGQSPAFKKRSKETDKAGRPTGMWETPIAVFEARWMNDQVSVYRRQYGSTVGHFSQHLLGLFSNMGDDSSPASVSPAFSPAEGLSTANASSTDETWSRILRLKREHKDMPSNSQRAQMKRIAYSGIRK